MGSNILNKKYFNSYIDQQDAKIVKNFNAMNEENQTRFGFVNFAETWNGRLAMMGILIGLGTELITGQSILRQIGIG